MAQALLTARLGAKVIAEGLAAPGAALTLGSAADCGLVVTDVTISRHHLEVELAGGAVRVKDLGSTNGTRLRGARITEELVPLSSVLLLGDVELCIEPAEPKNRLTVGDLESVSPPMLEAMKALKKAPGAVLIIGEAGTGKEVAARAIGPEPFHVVDCAAPPKELPHDGTLFLDHLDVLKAPLKPVLVNALQKQSSARIIAAAFAPTDLLDAVAAVPVRLPALRERPDDIPLLTRRFLREHGRKTAGFVPTWQGLQAQRWPGNVRELKAAVDDAVALRSDDELAKDFVRHLLARFDGDSDKAAQEAHVDRHLLGRLLKRWRLR